MIAQVGCGHWGKNLARNFADLGVLGAVADDHPETAARIAAQTGTEVRTFESLLMDPAIAGIALATPAITHVEMASRAISAGKHVFVEKPLALDPADGERLVQQAEDSGRVLMVGHLLQYHPIFVALRDLVADSELGALRYIYSNRLSLGKFRTEENVLWSFAPHDLSMMLSLTGEEPDHVTADGAAILSGSLADWCTCWMHFPSGVRGHIQTSWLHPFKEQRLTVIGDKAMAVFEDSAPQWEQRLALYRHQVDRTGHVPVPIKAEAEYVAVAPDEPLQAECRHFVECIRTGARPRTDGREGLRVLNTLSRAEAALARSLRHVPR